MRYDGGTNNDTPMGEQLIASMSRVKIKRAR